MQIQLFSLNEDLLQRIRKITQHKQLTNLPTDCKFTD